MKIVPSWHEEAISKEHNRTLFDCGNTDLNVYLKQYARKNHLNGGAKTFLAIDDQDGKSILGYYSITPASLAYDKTPTEVSRGLSRHEVPAFRLCRLAVDRSIQGCGLGGQLLLAAGRRVLRVASEVGGVVLLIDAKNDQVATWYESYGAIPLRDTPHSLVLPFATLHKILLATGKL